MATALSSGKENNSTATDPHLKKNLSKLQNDPTKHCYVQVAATTNATTADVTEVPVSLILAPTEVPSEEKFPPATVKHEGPLVEDICTIEEITLLPDLPVDGNKVSSFLSPNAPPWLPAAPSKNFEILYPPGKNIEGTEYKVNDDA